MAHRYAGRLENGIEGEAAPRQEGDEVVTPFIEEMGDFRIEHATPIDPIARQVGSKVGRWGRPPRDREAGLGHVKEWERPGVCSAEALEVDCVAGWKNNQVCLNESRGE